MLRDLDTEKSSDPTNIAIELVYCLGECFTTECLIQQTTNLSCFMLFSSP